MLKRIALLLATSTLALGLSGSALADAGTVMRVIVVKTDDVSAYMHELDKGKAIMKRLGITATLHVWRGTFAGADAGTVVVSQEYPSNQAFADGFVKSQADKEMSDWIKGLAKIRTIVSDSLYQGLY
jgi:hypothetical protein